MKHILISGANKGIGFAAARAILEEHADAIVILGSRDPDRGAAAVASLRDERPDWADRVAAVTLDVSDGASIAAARDEVLKRHGEQHPLHAIVNNAGIGLGSADMAGVLNVNTRGVQRMCEAFIPLVQPGGRVVNVSSASGPNFVNQCDSSRQPYFLDSSLGWADIESLLEQAAAHQHDARALEALGLGAGSPYGFSKALVNLYTMQLAQRFPELTINACTPGYIATDLTLPSADQRGMSPQELGMKTPADGARVILFLLFGRPHGSGHYYGSDGLRSPLDRYRAPGSPEYSGP